MTRSPTEEEPEEESAIEEEPKVKEEAKHKVKEEFDEREEGENEKKNSLRGKASTKKIYRWTTCGNRISTFI